MQANGGFRVSGKRVVTETPFLTLEEVDLETPSGETGKRLVVRIGGAVSVVPVVDDEVVLIRQYRTPVGRPVLEIPAGKLDVPGEDPKAAARRELQEEAGYRASELTEVAHFFTSPGFFDEEMTVYLATGLTRVESEPKGAEELAAEIVHIPIADLPAMLPDIEDAKSLIGLMAFLLGRDE